MPKLGEVYVNFAGQKQICTFVSGSIYNPGFSVWTAIPEGDDETGLGRRYFAAWVCMESPQPLERLEKIGAD